MPSASLSSLLPNYSIFSPRCSCCGCPSFRACFSRLRSFIFSESHKGNTPLIQIIPSLHGQLQFPAFSRNSELPSKRQVAFVDGFEEDSCFPQMEAYNSRFLEEAGEIPEFCAVNREIEVNENINLSGSGESPLSNSDLDAADAFKKFGGTPHVEQSTENLHHKDRAFVSLGTRNSSFNALELVKKVINLPDEERTKVLDLFDFDKDQLTIYEYNEILVALIRADECESAEVLFSEFTSQGISPDELTLSAMIQCFCRKNEPDKAKEILDVMLQKGLHPDIYTFTGLLSCLGKRGRLNAIYEVFDIMDRVGFEPTIRNYNSLIYGLCYVGKVEEALQVLDNVKKFVKGPDIYSYTFVMDGFCKVGRTDEAKKLHKEALKLGLAPTKATYNCLFNGYCKERRPLEALLLLKEMEGNEFELDIISYNTLLQELLKCGEIHAALGTYKKIREAGFQVDNRCMNTLIRVLCRQSVISGEFLEKAQEIFDEITCKGFGPSPYTYCLMVQTLAERGEIDAAMRLLNGTVADKCAPRIMTYNVILRILCDEARVDDALALLVIMIKRDAVPSRFSLSTLIDTFNKQGRLLDSSAVYSVAIKRCIFPHCKPRRD